MTGLAEIVSLAERDGLISTIGPTPLFAAVGDWLPGLITIAVFIFYALGHLISMVNQQKKPVAPRPQRPRPPQPAAPRPGQPAGGAQAQGPRPGSPAQEVEEFLRRAAEARASQSAPKEKQKGRRKAPPAPRPPAPRSEPVRRLVEAPSTVAQQRESVEQYVEKTLDVRSFAARAQQLSHVSSQSAHLAQEVEHKFDHAIGHLATSASLQGRAPSDEPQTVRAQQHPLLALLREPQGIRTALIVAELLQRPADSDRDF